MPDCGEALLDSWRGPGAAELLYVGGDVQRLHVSNRGDAGALAPCEKFPRRLRIGAARVDVADIGGEKFEKADVGARPNRQDKRGSVIEWREVVHGFALMGY